MKNLVLILVICCISLSIYSQLPPVTYKVNANITTNNPNISPNAKVYCYFNIFEDGRFKETIIKQFTFTGNNTYYFNSNFIFTSINTWTYELIGADGIFCFDDYEGNPSSWEVNENENFTAYCGNE